MPEEDKVSLIPPALQTEKGGLSIKKLLTKGSSPTTLVALIAALVSFYSEYQELKRTVAAREAVLDELRVSVDTLGEHMTSHAATSTEAIRERFHQNEQSLAELRSALGNLQTEVRVRHGVGFFPPSLAGVGEGEPVRLRRSEQIEAAAQASDRAYSRAAEALPQGDPLAGLEDFK
jgi:hypothetical protein